MFQKSQCWGLLVAFLVAAGSGCEKSPSDNSPRQPATNTLSELKARPVTIFRLHWVGMNRVLAESNSPSLKAIWDMPETRNLKEQTFERVAGLLGGGHFGAIFGEVHAASSTNQSRIVQRQGATNAMPLCPLFEDLINRESYWEVRQNPGSLGELALAVRTGEGRTRLWQSNLIAELGPGREWALPAGTNMLRWQMTNWITDGKTAGLRTLELRWAGDWVVLGLDPQTNGVTRDFTERASRGEDPSTVSAANFWITAEIDPVQVNAAFALGLELPAGLPMIKFGATSDGDSLRTQAQLDFPEPLPTPDPWNVPTNLIHDPLISFTALRGIRPWLSSLEVVKSLGSVSTPDQIYAWSQSSSPFSGYYAAPARSNFVTAVTAKLLRDANPWIDTNGLGRFERATNFNGVVWDGLNIIKPYLKMVPTPAGDFAFAGLETDANTNQPMPRDLLQAVLSRTNLLAYEWEFTGQRLEQWLYSGQFLRFVLHHAQVPPNSISFAWLAVLTRRLGNSVTTVRQTGPNQLSFGRRSDVGLSAAELDWLADWLESPQFPRVLNTFAGHPEPLPLKHVNHVRVVHTNSVPAVQH